MKVTILRGVPGSGKSTYVARNFAAAAWYSADNFFINDKGVYVFDPPKLPQAHGRCLKEFVQHLERRTGVDAVIDNTNTTAVEVAPYAALALAYGHELEIVTLQCDPIVAWGRNTHGVPVEAVKAMHRRLTEAQLMPWWPHRVVEVP